MTTLQTTARATATLPFTFTGVYRLFLRATSASVLHHNVAKKQLRSLWRPHFREAAKILHTLQDRKLSAYERTRREGWMVKWENGGTSRVFSPIVVGSLISSSYLYILLDFTILV